MKKFFALLSRMFSRTPDHKPLVTISHDHPELFLNSR